MGSGGKEHLRRPLHGKFNDMRICDKANAIIKRVCTCVEVRQKIIDDTIEGKLTIAEFICSLEDIGLNAAEVIKLCKVKSKNPIPSSCKHSPDLAQEDENTRESQAQAIEDAAWEALHEKLEYAITPSSITFEQLAEMLGDPKKSSGTSSIPQSVLTAVPHLVTLQENVLEDSHILWTWYLHQEYAKKKVVDSLISLGQLEPLKEPVF
ncbi:hypothetical protein C0989_008433 [Termitomyces sp. Mn162]|nr:hypothetical protein C0989_008433 [Termitomyces sp. Mn162]